MAEKKEIKSVKLENHIKIKLLTKEQCRDLKFELFSKGVNIHPGLVDLIVLDYAYISDVTENQLFIHIPKFKEPHMKLILYYKNNDNQFEFESYSTSNNDINLSTYEPDYKQFIESLTKSELKETLGDKLYNRLLTMGSNQLIPIFHRGKKWFLINPESRKYHDNGNLKVTSFCFCVRDDCSEVIRMKKNDAYGHSLFFGVDRVQPWLFYKQSHYPRQPPSQPKVQS